MEGELGQQDGSRSPDHIPRQEWAQKLLTEEGSKQIRGTVEARTGRCPVCRDKHVGSILKALAIQEASPSKAH